MNRDTQARDLDRPLPEHLAPKRNLSETLRAVDSAMRTPVPLPVPPPTNTYAGRNPLPAPDHNQANQWKIAWFVRAMRTEDMQDMARDLLAAKGADPIDTPEQMITWLLRWSRKEHGVADEKSTVVG